MSVWKNLDSAIAFGATAHAGQVRRYSGLPYILHPLEVMELLHDTLPIVTEDELIAAVLHDVVEDTAVGHDSIERRFGSMAAALVFDLTDQFTHQAHPDKNRALRKKLERERLWATSAEAQNIKLADTISNNRSIVAHDPGFARVYLPEMRELISGLDKAHPDMRLRAERSLTRAFSILNLEDLHEECRADGVGG